MWSIIITLALGIFLGSLIKLNDRQKKINAKLQHLGVILLLFFMGISIGINKDLLGQLDIIGAKSLTFGLLTTGFSIVCVYTLTQLTFGRKRHDH